MKISIIIPTYNSEDTLATALRSVLNQTFVDFEIWIIDGKSCDTTLSIIQFYATKDKRVNWISEPDNGIYDAMNKGIKLVKGNWVYFLGSDDKLYSKKILEEIFTMDKIDNYSVVYGNVIFKISGKLYDGKFNALKLLKKNICHQSIFIRKDTLDYVGFFDVKYIGTSDWHHAIKWFFDKSIRKLYINKTIAIYNEDGFSFNVKDEKFIKDRQLIIDKFFPLQARIVFKYKNSKFLGPIINKWLSRL